MLPGGIGFWEIMIILVVVLLVMGPAKIPEVAKTLGKGIRAARRAGQEIRAAIDPDDYRREFRAWELNHPIEDGEIEDASNGLAERSQEPSAEQNTVTPASPSPSGVYGTVSRSDDYALFDEEADLSDSSGSDANGFATSDVDSNSLPEAGTPTDDNRDKNGA